MIRSTRWKLIGAMLALATSGACSSLPLTPVVITATPDPRIIMITVTDTPVRETATPTTDPRAGAFGTLTAVAQNQIETSPTQIAVALQPTAASTIASTAGALPPSTLPAIPATTIVTNAPPTSAPPGPTATPNIFPTDTRMQIFIAQEDFQGGYMFWMQSTGNMWVLLPATLPNPGDTLTIPTNGQWRIYKDAYKEGEPESDPGLTPPEGRYQPRRGFGKLWRETSDLRTALGWATTPEFALSTSYVYQPGGYVNDAKQYVPGPGRHFLVTLGRTTFEFTEPAQGQQFGTWRKIG